MLSPSDPFLVPFDPSTSQPIAADRYPSPGTAITGTIAHDDLTSAHFSQIKQIIDIQLGGTSPNSGSWILNITPLNGPSGSAGARDRAPAEITYVAVNKTLAEAQAGIVTQATTNGTITGLSGIDSWSRVASYVKLAESPTGSAYLRVTGKTEGDEFDVELTPPTNNTATNSTIQSPLTTHMIVGGYCAIDRTRGYNGRHERDTQGWYVAAITSSTEPADIIGPIALGTNMEGIQAGDLYRYFLAGTSFGVFETAGLTVAAFAEAPILTTSIDGDVYVRHTASGNKKVGMVGDLTAAAAGATRAKWTGTPTAADSTRYLFQIKFRGNIVPFEILSDASATATEISNLARTEINKHTGTGGLLDGITASGTATVVLEGPTYGFEFEPSQLAASPGTIAWAHTTTGVTTHHKVTRADKIVGECSSAGPVPVLLGAPL
jgi:hypothetical protein